VETSRSFFLSNDFELALEWGQDPVRVGPHRNRHDRPGFFDDMEARKQVRNDLTSSFTAKHIGGVYPATSTQPIISATTGRFLPVTSWPPSHPDST